jgi:WD40 repeat protein
VSPGVTGDPPTASAMMVDPWHEMVILAVGHASGALKIHNIHSKGSAPVDLPMLHQGMVTCMLNVVGWVEACVLATAGVDGRIIITELAGARWQLTLHCHAPVLSLHKPSSVGEDSLGPFYKGANSTLLFACCSDLTLRCFSLSTGGLLFTGRSLDSPVKAVWRPNWAVVSDTVVCQTKAGTVYVYSMTSEHPQQIIELDAGANSFLQKHDLIVPGSQLSILAHRLYQMKHLKKKALPAISAGHSPTVSPPMSRSVSSSELRKQHSSSDLGAHGSSSQADPAMMGGETAKMIIDEGHFSSGLPAPLPSTGSSPSPSPDASSSPPPLSRARSTLMARATPASSSSRSLLSSVPNPRSLLQRQRSSGSNLVDSSFQKEIYRLNQQALLMSTEKNEEENRRHAQQHHASQQHHSALNPPVHQVAHAPPRSANTNPAAPAVPGNPLRAMYVNAPALSASPPPVAAAVAPVVRSPIACVDVVTASGSSASPLQHLHANVYVWNVHQLLPYLAAHAGVFLTFAKRRAAIDAAAADPSNAALQASAHAAQAANSTRLPGIFYVISGLISTLFDWDASSPLDPLLRSSLLLYPPFPPVSPASLSDNSQSMTLLLPNQAREWRRWEIDGEVTARHQMAMVTTMMSLMEKSDPASPALPWFAQCLQFYHTTIPRALRLYAEADLNVLALFALNVHRPVHTAARLLISLSLDRLSPSSRLDFALSHGHFFEYALPAQRMLFQPEFTLSPADLVASGSIMAVCENGPGIGYVSEEEMLHCALLCWLGLYELKQQRKNAQGIHMLRAADITSLATLHEGISAFQTKSQFLTNTLLRMIAWPVATEMEYVKCALACDLLAKGLLVFRHHITEPLLLLRRLYSLTQHPYDPLSKAATQCLLDSGKIAPTHFITCIGREAMNYRSTPTARQGALMSVVSLIKKHPFALARSLPAVVRMIVGTLDPAEPALRKTLLQASTSALYALAACYPQVSFNQATQRYAVGTANGPNSVIIVYDLRTATKWRVLEGHTGEVHAVSFHPKGLSLASYSATENPPSVRVWSTGGGGFLSGLLGMEGKCTNSWPMLPCVKQESGRTPETQVPPSVASKTSAASSASKSTATDSEEDDEAESTEIADVDEPVDDEDENDDGAPKSLAPRVQPRPVATAASGRASTGVPSAVVPARFGLEELMAVKLMWITEIAIKLRREDGTMVDFSM